MTEQSFETLKVWQKSHQLMLDVHHKLLSLLPKEEKYGLTDQMRRSSKSVGANIAEGAGRFYFMDNVRFCYISRGYLDETLNHLVVCKDLGFCENELYENLRTQIEESRRLLNGYITWLKTKKIGANEPGANLAIHELPAEYLVDYTD
jgi:four helix bundle protein